MSDNDPQWRFVQDLLAELRGIPEFELTGAIPQSSQAHISLDVLDAGVDLSDPAELYALIVGAAMPARLALDWSRQDGSEESMLFLRVRAYSLITMLTAVRNYLPRELMPPIDG